MKNRTAALLLALALPLSGCSAMLEREYQTVTNHVQVPLSDEDSAAIWVENYSELVSAILYQVSLHQETGIVRLRDWKGDVEDSLARACEEVSRDDPLGAYAVDRIQHKYTRMVTYYEAVITIDYRRTAEQIASVSTVTGSGAIRAELRDALAGFVTETAFRINYFDETQGEDYILDLVRQAYYDTPEAALGLPAAEVSLYPDSGQQRVVEVLLTYPEEPQVLREKSLRLSEEAQSLCAPFGQTLEGGALASALCGALQEHASGWPGEEGNHSTAYAALVEGAADSEGMALAFKELCDLSGISCTVVEGTLGGEPRFWNIITLPSGSRHMDPAGTSSAMYTDSQMQQAGFAWDTAAYPACSDPAGENI